MRRSDDLLSAYLFNWRACSFEKSASPVIFWQTFDGWKVKVLFFVQISKFSGNRFELNEKFRLKFWLIYHEMNERYENYESKKVDKVLGKCELITHKKK